MVPLPGPDSDDEADPAPSPSDGDSSDSEDEAFLSQLAQALATPSPKRPCLVRAAPDSEAGPASTQGGAFGPADWPIEVKSAVAAFLPWRELPRGARISQSWRVLERSDPLWKEFFRIQWPRSFHRKAAAHPQGGVPWRALFRQRWAEPNRNEDAEEEDWNDFSAALDLWKDSGPLDRSLAMQPLVKTLSEEQQVRHAVNRFKEDRLRLHSIDVPAAPIERGAAAHCAQQHLKCRHQPVPIDGKLDGCLFVCERCADVHICRPLVPCDGAVLSGNNEHFVCTVSGNCSDSGIREDRGGDSVAVHDWDPDLSASQQHARWFEQGYFMDEEQADDYFDGGSGRKQRQRARARPYMTAGGGSGSSTALVRCQECC